MFIRINCKLGLLGKELVVVPPAAPQFPGLAPQNLVSTNNAGVIALKLTCPDDPGANTVLRASRPQNAAVRRCRDYRIIGVCPAPLQGSADITALYTVRFGVVPAGKRIFVRASTMVDGFESLPRGVPDAGAGHRLTGNKQGRRRRHGSRRRSRGEVSRNQAVSTKARPHPGPLPRGEGEAFACARTAHLIVLHLRGQMVLPLRGAGERASTDTA